MAQVALQFMTADFDAVDSALRTEHALFLKKHKDVLVTFGPIRRADGTSAGYAYQTDFPGTDADGIKPFLAENPLAKAGLFNAATISGWRCALSHRQPTAPVRSSLQGFFFYGIATPNATERRNVLVEAHRARLMPKDNTNCLARGPLTDKDGNAWLGSAMVYEFPDRRSFDQLFANEPFIAGGIYERIDIFNWQRGEMAI